MTAVVAGVAADKAVGAAAKRAERKAAKKVPRRSLGPGILEDTDPLTDPADLAAEQLEQDEPAPSSSSSSSKKRPAPSSSSSSSKKRPASSTKKRPAKKRPAGRRRPVNAAARRATRAAGAPVRRNVDQGGRVLVGALAVVLLYLVLTNADTIAPIFGGAGKALRWLRDPVPVPYKTN